MNNLWLGIIVLVVGVLAFGPLTFLATLVSFW